MISSNVAHFTTNFSLFNLICFLNSFSSASPTFSSNSFKAGKYTSSLIISLSMSIPRYLDISTVLFPIILILLSSFVMYTTLTPECFIFCAASSVITSPAETKISPSSFITFSAATSPTVLSAMLNFLLYLYLPTLDKSYLLG